MKTSKTKNTNRFVSRGYNDCMKGRTKCPYKDEILQSYWSNGFDRAYDRLIRENYKIK